MTKMNKTMKIKYKNDDYEHYDDKEEEENYEDDDKTMGQIKVQTKI